MQEGGNASIGKGGWVKEGCVEEDRMTSGKEDGMPRMFGDSEYTVRSPFYRTQTQTPSIPKKRIRLGKRLISLPLAQRRGRDICQDMHGGSTPWIRCGGCTLPRWGMVQPASCHDIHAVGFVLHGARFDSVN